MGIFGRGKAAKGEGDEPKKYKKADLGESNKMYFNEELKMWVEKGKEEEARAAKVAAAAPPPAPSGMTPVPSGNNLAGGDSPLQSAEQKYARRGGIGGRYIVQPVGGIGSGPPSGASGPPSGKGLLPGASAAGVIPAAAIVPAGALVPAVGTKPPVSFFIPTPASSEAAGGSTPGSMSVSQSGVSMNDMVSNSGPSSTTAAVVGGSSDEPHGQPGLYNARAHGQTEALASTASSPPAGSHKIADSSEQPMAHDNGNPQRESSNGGRVPAVGIGGQNLSFGAWADRGSNRSPRSPYSGPNQAYRQPMQIASSDEAPAKQRKQSYEQHPSSPRYMQPQPDAQQQPSGSYAEANGNRHYAGHYECSNGGPAGLSGQHSLTAPASEREGGTSAVGAWGLGSSAAPDLAAQPATADAAATSAAWETGNSAAVASDPEGGSGGGYDSWQTGGTNFGQAGSATAAPAAPDPEGGAFGSWEQDTTYAGQPASAAAADGAWDAAAWGQGTAGNAWQQAADGATPQLPPADAYSADAYGQSADAYGQYAGWSQPGDAAAQQAYGQYTNFGYAAGTDHQQWQGYSQQPEGGQGTAPQGYPDANGYGYFGQTEGQYVSHLQQPGADSLPVQESSAGVAAVGASQQQAEQQQLPVVLDPVHPELPGIATTVGSVGSEDFVPSSSQQLGSAPAAASRYVDAPSRYQSAPGSAPHPARRVSGSLHNSLGLGPSPGRTRSLHSGGNNSISSLLPPARPSFSGSLGSPPKDSSAVIMPATAVAGDSSLMTTVRPSSPFARPVSPLARTTTGMSELSNDGKAAGLGFPIPSPPTAGLGKPNMFMPAIPSRQQSQAMTPWIPGAGGSDAAVAAAGGSSSMPWQPSSQPQQQSDVFGTSAVTVNGYAGPHYVTADGRAAASWAPPVNEQQPADSAAGTGGKVKHKKEVHFYDEFCRNTLAEVNWKLHPFEQPGKLNKLTPFEKFEQEQERRQQQQRKKSNKSDKHKAFYIKQMELRKKLPAGAVPSLSAPTVLLGDAVSATTAGTAGMSHAITDWQQHRQQQQQPYSEATTPPQRSKSAHATVHAAESELAEEVTPESKFRPSAADSEGGDAEAHMLAPTAAGGDTQVKYGNGYGAYDPLHHQQVPAAESAAADATALPTEVGGADEATGYDASQSHGQQQQQKQQQQQREAVVWPPLWTQCSPDLQLYFAQLYLPEVDAAYAHDPQYQGWFAEQYSTRLPLLQQQQQLAEQQAADGPPQQELCELPASAWQQGAEGELQQQPDQQQQLEQQQDQHLQLDGWGIPMGDEGLQQGAAAWDPEGGGTEHGAAADSAAASHLGSQPSTAAEHALAASDAAAAKVSATEASVQQLQEPGIAAAFDAVADAWGDDAGAFDALATPAEAQLAGASAAAAVACQDLAGTVAAAVTDAFDTAEQLIEEAVTHNAGVSHSSGITSQPSTATAAAAASKAIVGGALDKIFREHAENVAAEVLDAFGESTAADVLDSFGEQPAHVTAAAAADMLDAFAKQSAVSVAVEPAADALGDGWGEDELDLGALAAPVSAVAQSEAQQQEQATATDAAAAAAEVVQGATTAETAAAVPAAEEAGTAAAVSEAFGEGWEDTAAADAAAAGWELDAAGAEAAEQQQVYVQQETVVQQTYIRPQDWEAMVQQMETVTEGLPDPDGELKGYKEGFIRWGDAFFLAVGHLWSSPQQHTADEATAAELADRTVELDQATEMFSELQLQQKIVADTFGSQGLNIDELV